MVIIISRRWGIEVKMQKTKIRIKKEMVEISNQTKGVQHFILFKH